MAGQEGQWDRLLLRWPHTWKLSLYLKIVTSTTSGAGVKIFRPVSKKCELVCFSVKIMNFVFFGVKKSGIGVFLVSVENGAGVKKMTNFRYGQCLEPLLATQHYWTWFCGGWSWTTKLRLIVRLFSPFLDQVEWCFQDWRREILSSYLFSVELDYVATGTESWIMWWLIAWPMLLVPRSEGCTLFKLSIRSH